MPPPPQQDSGKSKEKNNGYVVRPPGSEPLEGHRRYTKIREINSGAWGIRLCVCMHVSSCTPQLIRFSRHLEVSLSRLRSGRLCGK